MWIQLLVPKRITIAGAQKQYKPGDWVDVGRQTAQLWIGAGEARTLSRASSAFPQGCGIVMRGKDGSAALDKYRDYIGLAYRNTVALDYERTLLWNVAALPNLRVSLVSIGFNLISPSKWQMAAPLLSYTEFACDVGAEDERKRTLDVIRDLRVPLYDTRLIFVARCNETRKLVAAWLDEMGGGDERLAFLRVLYRFKPVICALPTSWGNR